MPRKCFVLLHKVKKAEEDAMNGFEWLQFPADLAQAGSLNGYSAEKWAKRGQESTKNIFQASGFDLDVNIILLRSINVDNIQ